MADRYFGFQKLQFYLNDPRLVLIFGKPFISKELEIQNGLQVRWIRLLLKYLQFSKKILSEIICCKNLSFVWKAYKSDFVTWIILNQSEDGKKALFNYFKGDWFELIIWDFLHCMIST